MHFIPADLTKHRILGRQASSPVDRCAIIYLLKTVLTKEGKIIAEKTKVVEVVPYDPAWKAEYARIEARMLEIAGDLIIAAEHVGSTSIEGLSAKPVIDIDLVMESYERRRRSSGDYSSTVMSIRAIWGLRAGSLPEREGGRIYEIPPLRMSEGREGIS